MLESIHHHMSDLKKKLQNILSLTDTEAAVYVAALPYPAVGVNELVKLTNIKRTTVYHAVDTLLYKGLASRKSNDKRALFSMVSPQFLQHNLAAQIQEIEEQQKNLTNLIPDLALLQKNSLFGTDVRHYQGVSGVKAVYEEALYCKSREWKTITPGISFLEQFGVDFHDYVAEVKNKRKLRSKLLWEEVKKNKPRTPKQTNSVRDVRVMPKTMEGKFKSKVILFDKKVALITPATDAGAIIIDSPEIHAMFDALFDVIWDVSIPAVI
ncbi:MAG: hypothetical protein KAZ30_00455 [Candidatus Magasanikbacteria bacterium]|nr:hypothetical protein [Candidatus Magasanikbacteria bacterium]